MRVGVRVTLNLNLGDYQSAKYEFTVGDIDPESPKLAEELARGAEGMALTAKWVEEQLWSQISANPLMAQAAQKSRQWG